LTVTGNVAQASITRCKSAGNALSGALSVISWSVSPLFFGVRSSPTRGSSRLENGGNVARLSGHGVKPLVIIDTLKTLALPTGAGYRLVKIQCVITAGAQTERRGSAGPVRVLLGGGHAPAACPTNPSGRFLGASRFILSPSAGENSQVAAVNQIFPWAASLSPR
jgi:hypothetical protein